MVASIHVLVTVTNYSGQRKSFFHIHIFQNVSYKTICDKIFTSPHHWLSPGPGPWISQCHHFDFFYRKFAKIFCNLGPSPLSTTPAGDKLSQWLRANGTDLWISARLFMEVLSNHLGRATSDARFFSACWRPGLFFNKNYKKSLE